MNDPQPDQALRQRIAQLEQERAEWQREHEQLVADIDDQACHIRDAWERLEKERRTTMQVQAKATTGRDRSTSPQSQLVKVLAPSANPTTSGDSESSSLTDQFRTIHRQMQQNHGTTGDSQ